MNALLSGAPLGKTVKVMFWATGVTPFAKPAMNIVRVPTSSRIWPYPPPVWAIEYLVPSASTSLSTTLERPPTVPKTQLTSTLVSAVSVLSCGASSINAPPLLFWTASENVSAKLPGARSSGTRKFATPARLASGASEASVVETTTSVVSLVPALVSVSVSSPRPVKLSRPLLLRMA